MTIVKNKKSWLYVSMLVLVVIFSYRYSPYKIPFLGHYDKIWAHRVNSTERLTSAVNYFKGIELDLVYYSDTDFLDVNHPPAESVGLEFEDYISNLEMDQTPYIWLDIKNLNSENCDAIFDRLLTIFKSRSYPQNRVLIESMDPKALKKFGEFGFKTSYYLPPELYLKNKIELKSEISKIKQIITEQPELGISTDYKDYYIIKEYFPNHKKYIWILVSSVSFEFTTIRKILNDKNVDVVLVNYKTLQGNR